MKLTFILDNFATGGKERRCLQLIQGLLRNNLYHIQVIIIDGDIEYKELKKCDIDLTIIYRQEKHKTPRIVLTEVKQAIKSFQPDIVQAWGYMSAFYTLPLALSKKFVFIASYVADVMEPDTLLKKYVNHSCIKKSNCIIGNSEQGLKAYHIPPDKAVCIYNGFNEDRFHRVIDKESYKRELGIETAYVVSMTASFYQAKDWKCFIESARLVARKRNDITFLCIGSGPDWNRFHNLIDNDEKDKIRLLGRRSDIDELLQITDLSVLCTNPKVKEGLSNAIVESMAWGVPVLATAGGGTPEILEEGKNGLLIHRQEPEIVAGMIEQLVDDPMMRERMSVYGKEVIKQRFLLADKINQYQGVYRKCVLKN